ncbi:MAG: lipopolysaccharide biosynthesis protein [Prevotella sp.]|nr:lipopolysaccharide biosynthesis protein [Prevotella sp.]
MAKSLKEKTASGLFWAAMNNGMMQLLNVVIGIVLMKLLSPEDYGLVGLLAIFSAIATTLQESGFTSALTNMKRPSANDYNSVFWFSSLMGLLLYAILFFSAPLIAEFYHQEKLVLLSRVCFLGILLSAIGIAPQAYLYKNLIVKEATYLRIGVLSVSGLVGITLAFAGKAYWSLVAQQLTYIALINIGKFFLTPWRPSWSVDFGPVRRMFAFSCKIMVTNIITQVSNNILSVIFGKLLPLRTVGNFTQAYKWNNMASSLVSGTIAQVAQPVFASINDERARQLAVLRKMMRFTAFLSFPVMLGLAIVSREFIMLVSEKWAGCIPLLQILCIGGAFLPLYQPLQNLIVSRGRSDVFMWCNIVQIALQIALILLSSRFGVLIMVGVYTAFNILWLLVWQQIASRIIGLRLPSLQKDTAPFLLAAALASLVATATAWKIGSVPASFAVKVVVAAAAYYGIMKLAGAEILRECTDYLFRLKAPQRTKDAAD